MSVTPRGPHGDGLPNVAVITMVRDEAVMLPRWVAHYGREVGVQNLVVIDDNSVDGSTDDLPCPVIKVPHLTKKPFEAARMGMASGIAAGLLEVYDAVVFCDADEFLVAEPTKYDSLRHFVAARKGFTALGVMTLNVIHQVGAEPPLDPDRPILGQRKLAKFVPLMCKPSLKAVAAPWVAASHGIKTRYTVDPELYMFHMKFADRDLLRAAGDHRRRMVEMDGRASPTNWKEGGDNMVALLDRIVEGADAGDVPLFKPPRRKLGEIVHAYPGDIWRASGTRQVTAMENRPMVKIPPRFHGRV